VIHIKNFIHKVKHAESSRSRNVTLTLAEARQLADDIALLLADRVSTNSNVQQDSSPAKPASISISDGGHW
jgi:hypothetical protein